MACCRGMHSGDLVALLSFDFLRHSVLDLYEYNRRYGRQAC